MGKKQAFTVPEARERIKDFLYTSQDLNTLTGDIETLDVDSFNIKYGTQYGIRTKEKEKSFQAQIRKIYNTVKRGKNPVDKIYYNRLQQALIRRNSIVTKNEWLTRIVPIHQPVFPNEKIIGKSSQISKSGYYFLVNMDLYSFFDPNNIRIVIQICNRLAKQLSIYFASQPVNQEIECQLSTYVDSDTTKNHNLSDTCERTFKTKLFPISQLSRFLRDYFIDLEKKMNIKKNIDMYEYEILELFVHYCRFTILSRSYIFNKEYGTRESLYQEFR